MLITIAQTSWHWNRSKYWLTPDRLNFVRFLSSKCWLLLRERVDTEIGRNFSWFLRGFGPEISTCFACKKEQKTCFWLIFQSLIWRLSRPRRHMVYMTLWKNPLRWDLFESEESQSKSRDLRWVLMYRYLYNIMLKNGTEIMSYCGLGSNLAGYI